MICPICGKPKPDYQYGDFFPDSQCLGHNFVPSPTPSSLNPITCKPLPVFCDHCFCLKEYNHKKCCMCGTLKEIKKHKVPKLSSK